MHNPYAQESNLVIALKFGAVAGLCFAFGAVFGPFYVGAQCCNAGRSTVARTLRATRDATRDIFPVRAQYSKTGRRAVAKMLRATRDIFPTGVDIADAIDPT